jgi:DNA processing protein
MSGAPLGRRLTDAERVDWLRLIRSENVGPQTFHQLLGRYRSAARALAALPELSRRGGLERRIALASRADAEREIAAAERAGHHIIALGEPDYPPALAVLDAPPPILTVHGDPQVLQRPAIAMVGSRNASMAGRKMCRKLAAEFGDAGIVVVSGLARGIDAAAHQAALDTGTIAVIAGGHDRLYPPEHQALAAEIAERGGAVLTEMPAGWVARAQDFPRRNRLISGLSQAVVVVEAAHRSGSLITARYALEQNRDVYAVPGSPLDPRAEGCNALIKSGARLITTAADALETRGLAEPFEPPAWLEALADVDDTDTAPAADADAAAASDAPDADAARRIAELLGPAPVAVDDIVRETALSAREVQLAIIELELAGRIERHAGGRISRIM